MASQRAAHRQRNRGDGHNHSMRNEPRAQPPHQHSSKAKNVKRSPDYTDQSSYALGERDVIRIGLAAREDVLIGYDDRDDGEDRRNLS